jgi:small-conductance mechanosensitive channel
MTTRKRLNKMTAAEIEAEIPQIEAKLADVDERLARAAGTVKHKAVELLGQEGGLERLKALSDELVPLTVEQNVTRLALEGAREAMETARAREREQSIATARESLQADLSELDALAAEIEHHADEAIDKLVDYQRRIFSAINGAKAKLSADAGKGFRVTGATMANFTSEHLRHALDIHLHHRTGGFWKSEAYPVMRGGLFFSRLVSAAHAQLLGDFEMRYTSDHPEGG